MNISIGKFRTMGIEAEERVKFLENLEIPEDILKSVQSSMRSDTDSRNYDRLGELYNEWIEPFNVSDCSPCDQSKLNIAWDLILQLNGYT